MTDRPTRSVDDVDSLRALVHPLRLHLLGLLRIDGPATASHLARRVGESSGATSYHLRQLARYGFVEEDPDQPSRRERRWRSVAESTTIKAAGFAGDPSAWAAVDRLVRIQIERFVRQATAFLSAHETWGKEWLDAAASSDWSVRMTPERLSALVAEVSEVVDRHRDEAQHAQPASSTSSGTCPGIEAGEHVTVFLSAVPVREEDLP